MKTDELVEKYIELRDRKAKYKASYDAQVLKVDTALEKIESILMRLFDESGSESVRTANGTAYKQVRTSATVADWDISLKHIIDTGAWELLEKRVSKKAVEAYIEEHEVPPPGVNIRQEVVINVRRS